MNDGMRSSTVAQFTPHYQGRIVLVTGADGFIGSHLVDALLDCGAKLEILVRGTARTGCGMWDFRCLEVRPERFVNIFAGDLGSADIIEILKRSQSSIIFHLGAIAYVNYSFDHPLEVFRANATGTLHLLEGARRRGDFQRVVVQSSSEVYGTRQKIAIAEDHPLEPTSPYAASKLAAERLAISYLHTFGLPVAIARPFNVYGPRHRYDVVPKFLELAMQDEPLTVNGDGSQERDFSFVEDTLRGLLALGWKGVVGESYNLGSGTATSVLELAHTILRVTASKSPILHGPPRQGEVRSHRADVSKSRSVLGHETQVSLEMGLSENADWMRRRRSR